MYDSGLPVGGLPVAKFDFNEIIKRFQTITQYKTDNGNVTSTNTILNDKKQKIQLILNQGSNIGLTNQLSTASFTTPGNVYTPKELFDYLYLQDLIASKLLTAPVNSYNIYFFTFGAFLKALNLEPSFIFIGGEVPINFIDNKLQEVTDNQTIQNLKNDDNEAIYVFKNKIKYCNIFDIPIALSTFKSWVIRNIITPKISSMSINTFLNSCINDLLVSAIQPTNEDFFAEQNIKFKYFYDRIKINNNNAILTQLEKITTNGLKEKDLITTIKTTLDLNISYVATNEQKTEKNVIVFYGIPKYFNRKRDTDKDLEDSVPSFYYGEQKSFVNKITFKENTIP